MKDRWINLNCFRTLVFLWLAIGLATQALASSNWVAYVSDGGSSWSNFDLFARNLDTSATTQLTTNAAIDNHPDISPDGAWIVFSSTRGLSGEFDLYLADFTNVEGTIRQLTFDTYTNGPQSSYPDRHPHFHSNGRTIVFTSKNRPLTNEIQVISECCVPKIIVPPRFYENLNLITLTPTGTVSEYIELDLRDAWDPLGYPDIWTNSSATYVGHPSFSHAGTQILFTASIDGDGKVWEVYTAGFDTNLLDLVSNSLRRITSGPVLGSNPIQMSGGAHYSENDSTILFSSTRTPNGNSLIFSVLAGATNVPVTSATQMTSHVANDYVPEPLPDGSFIVTSDLYTPSMSTSDDLDLVLIDPVGVRSNMTDNDVSDEMLLIGDEVSWFCGLGPNLSAHMYYPKTFSVESLWLERSALRYLKGYDATTPIPPNLLSGFGYPDQAIRMYALGWKNMEDLMKQANPSLWAEMQICLQTLDASGFPGLGNESALLTWMQDTESTRVAKHVVPSIMYGRGLGAEWTPWVTTWENPTGGLFGAPANWDLGLPGSNDIARFDGGVLGGPAVVTVNITNETELRTIEIELVQLSLTGLGTNLPPLNVTSNLTIGGSTGVTSVVVSNIDLTADKIIMTTNANMWMMDSFFDITYQIDLIGMSNRFIVSTGAVVRAPKVELQGLLDTSDTIRVAGGRLTVTNAAGTATVSIAGGSLELYHGTTTVDRIICTSESARIWFQAGTLIAKSMTVSNGLSFAVGNDFAADGNVDITDFAVFQTRMGETSTFANGLIVGEDGDLSGDGVIVSGFVQCLGSLSPGKSPGILTIQGSLILTNTAVVNIELAGRAPGTEYDQLQVTGSALLNGSLRATLLGGFSPTNGDSFVVLTYGSVSNTFATPDLPVLAPDKKWSATYGSTSLVIAVTNIPDGDVDGMDDDWEVANFTNTTFSDGAGDADGDGMSDYEEYVAMTQPTNAASALRIGSMDFFGSAARMSFASVARVPYALEYRDSLTAEPSWAEETNGFGSGGNVVFTNQPPSGVTNRFYRVKVRR